MHFCQISFIFDHGLPKCVDRKEFIRQQELNQFFKFSLMPSRKDDGTTTDSHRINLKRKEAAKKGQSSRAIGPTEIIAALVVIAGQCIIPR
jgi:hypothetical protein